MVKRATYGRRGYRRTTGYGRRTSSKFNKMLKEASAIARKGLKDPETALPELQEWTKRFEAEAKEKDFFEPARRRKRTKK